MSNIIRRNYDPFFGDLFDFPFFTGSTSSRELMKTDIEELENAYELRIEVPSVKKEDIKVSLENGYLTVLAEKKNNEVNKDNHGKVIHKERYFGEFKRSYYVGDEFKFEDVSATLQDGVLTLNLKKPIPEEKKENERKYIQIN